MRKSLTKQLEELTKESESVKKTYTEFKAILSEFADITGSKGRWDTLDVELLRSAIYELVAYRKRTEGMQNVEKYNLMAENDKLWHMVRTLTKDETLLRQITTIKEPNMERTVYPDPFIKRNHNNDLDAMIRRNLC